MFHWCCVVYSLLIFHWWWVIYPDCDVVGTVFSNWYFVFHWCCVSDAFIFFHVRFLFTLHVYCIFNGLTSAFHSLTKRFPKYQLCKNKSIIFKVLLVFQCCHHFVAYFVTAVSGSVVFKLQFFWGEKYENICCKYNTYKQHSQLFSMSVMLSMFKLNECYISSALLQFCV